LRQGRKTRILTPVWESSGESRLSTLVPWWQYVLGVGYVLTILYLPSGLMGIPERLRQRRNSPGKQEAPKKLASVPS
jgi:hypothetical protein